MSIIDTKIREAEEALAEQLQTELDDVDTLTEEELLYIEDTQ